MARRRQDQMRGVSEDGPEGLAAQASFFEQRALPATGDKKADDDKPIDDRLGHRQRLRARFKSGGDDAIADYELLEMILFRVFPRGDTKPIAKRLIAKFGSFAEVVNASPERLAEVEDIGDRAIEEIKFIRAAALRLMRADITKREVLGSWNAVIEYCRAAQGFDGLAQVGIQVGGVNGRVHPLLSGVGR